MLDLHFLVRFPSLYQCRPALIAKIYRAAGHVDEAIRADLTAPNERDHEAVGECPQLFGKVKSQRGAS